MGNKILIGFLVIFNILVGIVILQSHFGIKIPRYTLQRVETSDNTTKPIPRNIIKTDASRSPSIIAVEGNVADVSNFAIMSSQVTPEKVAASKYEMVIVNEADSNSKLFNREDVSKMKSGNKVILADISFTYAETPRWYWNENWSENKPSFLGEALTPTLYYVKDWLHPEWWKITKGIIDKAIESGYDGIVISDIDIYVELGGAKSLRDKMVDYVIAISKYAKSQKPGFAIIVKNGELLGHIPQYVAAIDGLITDGLVYSSSSNGISGSRTNLTTMTKRMNDLNQVKMADKPVYVVEYVSGSAWTTAKNLLKTNGYIGYSSPSKIPTTIRESTW